VTQDYFISFGQRKVDFVTVVVVAVAISVANVVFFFILQKTEELATKEFEKMSFVL